MVVLVLRGCNRSPALASSYQDRARCDPDVTGHEWPLNATEGKVCKPATGGRPASVCHACMCTGWETLLEETFTPLRPLFDNGTHLGVFL